jgi:hypothetical protein
MPPALCLHSHPHNQVCYPTTYLAPDVSGPAADADQTQERIGVCVAPVPGLWMPSRLPQQWPVPVAYFPLSEVRGSLRSAWPGCM